MFGAKSCSKFYYCTGLILNCLLQIQQSKKNR